MSRTTRNINQITQELDRISGLDGIVADKMENLADEVHSIVEEILTNHSKQVYLIIMEMVKVVCLMCSMKLKRSLHWMKS